METLQATPAAILQVGMGFWASKTLLTAVNMEVFTFLSEGEKSGLEIQHKLGLHSRSLYDFLDTLVALGFLNRSGIKESAVYENTVETDLFLDKNKPSYIGGILEMTNNRLYPFWNDLEIGLKTGLPQNETKHNGQPLFEVIYNDPHKLREFIQAMAGVQTGNFMAFSEKFDFSEYTTLCDIGGCGGHLSAHVVLKNPHMKCSSFDLPQVEPIAKEVITKMNLNTNITLISGDFFTDDFPQSDIITMGNVLHDWGEEDKIKLINKAYKALPSGGALVVIENIIDDARRENAFGLLMSLNMLIETENGFDFTFEDFNKWTKQAGFTSTELMPLTGATSAAIAYK
ncbi:methyltransferase [uncultured Gelidibacter sp.]|uniref:methyltransferase n=1 Tax=uncultured Gelidibacter sp. TaxID=259318 RepID=UPI00262D15E2|nr:methyltransferase [uncultured Gelidibacter sp.]